MTVQRGASGRPVPVLLTVDVNNGMGVIVREGGIGSYVSITNVSGQSTDAHIEPAARDVWIGIKGAGVTRQPKYPDIVLLLAGGSITLPGDAGDILARAAQAGNATLTIVVTNPE